MVFLLEGVLSKVFLHLMRNGNGEWADSQRDFLRLPTLGEMITPKFGAPFYKVTLVVHCPFNSQYDAEVFAVQVNPREELTKAEET